MKFAHFLCGAPAPLLYHHPHPRLPCLQPGSWPIDPLPSSLQFLASGSAAGVWGLVGAERAVGAKATQGVSLLGGIRTSAGSNFCTWTGLRVKWVICLLLGEVKEGGMRRNCNYFLPMLWCGLTFFPVKMHDFDYHHPLSQAAEHAA